MQTDQKNLFLRGLHVIFNVFAHFTHVTDETRGPLVLYRSREC